MRKMDEMAGATAINARVIGLLRGALETVARAALARLPEAERAGSTLANQVAMPLKDQGKLGEAEPLCREALAAHRETLGWLAGIVETPAARDARLAGRDLGYEPIMHFDPGVQDWHHT